MSSSSSHRYSLSSLLSYELVTYTYNIIIIKSSSDISSSSSSSLLFIRNQSSSLIMNILISFITLTVVVVSVVQSLHIHHQHHHKHHHHQQLRHVRRIVSLAASSSSLSSSSSTPPSIDDVISTTSSECNSCDDGSKCEQPKPLSALSVNVNDVITLTEIADENVVNIVNLKYTDQECNVLAWKCLGYQYNKQLDTFELSSNVFPKWASKYPDPPDLIGITRRYDPETDKVVRNASMDLMRSIPRTFKGGVRSLVSVGFKGYKLNELTPNKTRRAQLCNWIIYYREKLFGKTLEELKAEREKEASENSVPQDIKDLPSEQWYQRNRLDASN